MTHFLYLAPAVCVPNAGSATADANSSMLVGRLSGIGTLMALCGGFPAVSVDFLGCWSVRVSIVASISACHAEDPGSIPGLGAIT